MLAGYDFCLFMLVSVYCLSRVFVVVRCRSLLFVGGGGFWLAFVAIGCPLPFVGVRWRLLAFVGVCWRWWAFVGVRCRWLPLVTIIESCSPFIRLHNVWYALSLSHTVSSSQTRYG